MTATVRTRETREQMRLRIVVEEAKRLGTYAGVNWDNFAWDINKYEKPLAHWKHQSAILYFTVRRRTRSDPHIPYEQPYADFAKAFIRTRASERGLTRSGHAHVIIALRYLYTALQLAGKSDPTEITIKHFKGSIADARERARGWTLFHVGKALQQISEWLDERDLTRIRIGFKNPIPHPGHGDGLDPESQAKGLLKMPSAAALEALADISNNPLDDNERILLRIIDLLVIGGFRIGEVLRLPLDCLVETLALDDKGSVKIDSTTGAAIMRYGIRYWPEKGGDPYVKWLSDIAVPIARRAVEDLTRLCSEARAAAEVLEKNPDRVPLPVQLPPDELVDLKRVATIFGVKSVQMARRILVESLGLKPATTHKPSGRYAFLFRVRDVERVLLKRRQDIVIIRRPDSRVQMLSESLCVMFQNQFHTRKPVYKFLPELVGVTQINDALGCHNKSSSVFSRRGLKEPDGTLMRIRTHAFRHWLNTLMSRGGLSDVELARWSGRRNIDQNAAYKHGTVEQRVAWAHEMIKEGQLRGTVADTYHAIDDPVDKEEFLKTFANVALFTPYGVCVHDYAIDPCPYHLNCLGGCPEYLRTKGDKEEQKNIVEVLNFHLVQLRRATKAGQEGAAEASNYAAHCNRIIEGAKAALEVDGVEIADGQMVNVFPDGKVPGVAVT
jgi:hypothetical protein